jgi:hypothetical protein
MFFKCLTKRHVSSLGCHQASTCNIRHKIDIQTCQTNLYVILNITEEITQEKCIVCSTYCTCLKWCTIGIMISSVFALIVKSSQAKAYREERLM